VRGSYLQDYMNLKAMPPYTARTLLNGRCKLAPGDEALATLLRELRDEVQASEMTRGASSVVRCDSPCPWARGHRVNPACSGWVGLGGWFVGCVAFRPGGLGG
jgi:hypothetical protein